MIDFDKIKVIIWDLDDTFWDGTLSEGKVTLSEEKRLLINNISDSGVINTICSKNDFEPVKDQLKEFGLWDLFVFPSINWEPKGIRVNTLLKDMALRSANALFIDDNISNIKEVEYYNKGIMSAGPNDIPSLVEYFLKKEKKDAAHKRLSQYKILEKKNTESKQFNSNIEFLESCNIHVSICNDSINVINRINELVQRTNQLNFTKVRSSLEELTTDISNPNYLSGYVKVYDRFGDYGIVGFYLIQGNRLKHFLFSCRTIGLGIEQYVYNKLGRPEIQIVPEVAASLTSEIIPHWIHDGSIDRVTEKISGNDATILFKGPCDMSGLVGYLQMENDIDTDFTFTNDNGCLIESHNHSCHIYGSHNWLPSTIERLRKDAFFINDDCIKKTDFNKYKVIFLSTLIEGIYGRYTHKENGATIVFGHYNYPLTNKDYWEDYINSIVQNYGYKITIDQLEIFSDNFLYTGRTSPEEYISFLTWLYEYIPHDSILCLILGSEISFEKEKDPSYLDRAEYHRRLNDAIRVFSRGKENIKLIEITHYIHSQNDFSNNINHFTPSVYYYISRDVLSIIKERNPTIKAKTSTTRYLIKQYVQPFIKKIFPKKAYNCIKRMFS